MPWSPQRSSREAAMSPDRLRGRQSPVARRPVRRRAPRTVGGTCGYCAKTFEVEETTRAAHGELLGSARSGLTTAGKGRSCQSRCPPSSSGATARELLESTRHSAPNDGWSRTPNLCERRARVCRPSAVQCVRDRPEPKDRLSAPGGAAELRGRPEVAEHREAHAPGDREPAVVADPGPQEQAASDALPDSPRHRPGPWQRACRC